MTVQTSVERMSTAGTQATCFAFYTSKNIACEASHPTRSVATSGSLATASSSLLFFSRIELAAAFAASRATSVGLYSQECSLAGRRHVTVKGLERPQEQMPHPGQHTSTAGVHERQADTGGYTGITDGTTLLQ